MAVSPMSFARCPASSTPLYLSILPSRPPPLFFAGPGCESTSLIDGNSDTFGVPPPLGAGFDVSCESDGSAISSLRDHVVALARQLSRRKFPSAAKDGDALRV